VFLGSITALIVLLISVVKDHPDSPKEVSFWGGVVSVARRGTLHLDGLPQLITIDKAYFKGRYYPATPLFLTFFTGKFINIIFSVVKPDLLRNDIPIYKAATYINTTIPLLGIFLITAYLFLKKTRIPLFSFFISLPLVFCTLLFSYSRYLTNHILVAFFTLILFAVTFEFKKLLGWKLYLIQGLLLSLMYASDASFAFVVFVSFCLYSLFEKIRKKKSASFSLKFFVQLIIGALPIFITVSILNFKAFKTIFPPQVQFEKYFGYEGSHFSNIDDPLNINVYRSSILIGVFNQLFGSHGIFLYTPILFFFFFYRNKRDMVWKFLLFVLLCSVITYSVVSPNFGGWSYGNRRLLPLIPPLYYYSVLYVLKKKKSLITFVFILTLLVSFFFSYIGFKNTWFNKRLYINRNFSYFPLLYNLNKDYLGGKIHYDL